MAQSTISQQAGDVRQLPRLASIGELVYSNYLDRFTEGKNRDPQAKQSDTVTVTGATNDKPYTITINNVDVTYTSDSSATLAEIADGLATAVNAEPSVRAVVEASSDSVDTVTLTSIISGLAYTLTKDDAQLTTASVTANAEADSIAFGVGVISTEAFTSPPRYVKNAKSTALTAQVDQWLLTFDLDVQYVVTIEIEGSTYQASTFGVTDLGTTLTALVAAVEAAMPANTVAASESGGDTLVLTSELAGKPFVSAFSFAAPSGATVDTGTATYSGNVGLATDITKALVGVSLYTEDEEVTEVGGTEVVYPALAMVNILAKGVIWVERDTTDTINYGDSVYIELDGSGDNFGRFYNSTSATRALLPDYQWERQDPDGDGLAALRVA